MPWWIVLPVATVAYFSVFWIIAAQRAIEDAKNGVPEGKRRGVSLLPTIPFYPLAAWGIAAYLDDSGSRWGSTIVVWFHIALLVLSVAINIFYGFKLRAIRKQPEDLP